MAALFREIFRKCRSGLVLFCWRTRQGILNRQSLPGAGEIGGAHGGHQGDSPQVGADSEVPSLTLFPDRRDSFSETTLLERRSCNVQDRLAPGPS
jgi:hypothetical protein